MSYRKLLAGLCLASTIIMPGASHAGEVAGATYVADLQPAPMFLVIHQNTVEALYSGVAGNIAPNTGTTPMSWSGIGVNAAGNALGMAIVAAAVKADNHHFAENHIAALRDASKGANLTALLQQAMMESIKEVSWIDGASMQNVADIKEMNPPPQATAWLQVDAQYALSTDFSHVVVIADVELFRQMPGNANADWRRKPVFHNKLVFQSDAIHIADKTPADSERMVAEENARWDQAAINAEIDQLNQASKYDTVAIKQRRAVLEKIDQHNKKLIAAKSPHWDREQLADRYAQTWGADDGAALKQALHDGGAELGKMVALSFSDQHDNVKASSVDGSPVSSDAKPRRLDYKANNGDVLSVLGSEPLMVGPYFTGS